MVKEIYIKRNKSIHGTLCHFIIAFSDMTVYTQFAFQFQYHKKNLITHEIYFLIFQFKWYLIQI